MLGKILHRQKACLLRLTAVTKAVRRPLHLAPPFLLDDYIPRYLLLSSQEVSCKRSLAYAHLRHCNLCPRLCGVDRYKTSGYCLIGADTVKVNVISPHFGEEPCIQGHHGSGSIFFSGCNLRCVFCQNHDIAHQRKGFDLTPEELADWMIKLQEVGQVHNINFITPEHVVPQVALAILHARDKGLKIPTIYNSSAFDSLDSLKLMDGLIDIYLPDMKAWRKATCKRLLKADDYAETAMESIMAMYKQVGDLSFTSDGLAKKGLLVRHLVMPGMEDEGIEIVKWLASSISKDTFVNIMEQYHPDAYVGKKRRRQSPQDDSLDVRYADINRVATDNEVIAIIKAAREAGLWRLAGVAKHGGFNL